VFKVTLHNHPAQHLLVSCHSVLHWQGMPTLQPHFCHSDCSASVTLTHKKVMDNQEKRQEQDDTSHCYHVVKSEHCGAGRRLLLLSLQPTQHYNCYCRC
jgi:hypothetical protein